MGLLNAKVVGMTANSHRLGVCYVQLPRDMGE